MRDPFPGLFTRIVTRGQESLFIVCGGKRRGGGGVKGDHIGCFQGDRKETSRRQQSIDEGWGRGL